MDIEGFNDQCCKNCEDALESMNKWFYLDEQGIKRGPYNSFAILYYIYSSYFEDDSPFFLYDEENRMALNYNTLENYLETIIEDVKLNGSHVFSCSHIMEQLMKNEENLSDPDDSTSEIHGSISGYSSPPENKAHMFRSEAFEAGRIYTSGEIEPMEDIGLRRHSAPHTRLLSKESSEQGKPSIGQYNSSRSLSTQQSILRKRLENNFKEAEAHLSRINTRKISHVIEKNLNHGNSN
ncbi:hypothetical protein BEWA_009710 [Theileria equi strain WA]|uniref:GYF domain-containing protein n=1 Tax=Theileria equi strain WA TaxID=1537102 RepID=L0B117_THEEQ|nr:hypothetical protein BEWA_009710 [Theileria equi strain WA]AFZ81557.1 hypothetical protein BEWA_009710 [Theileria equi strain WA]|eukprot:XP_004831223.1 hypothetical protein BEWA_009710 [Theileria equi strain WA]